MTPLQYAAKYNPSPAVLEVLEILLKAGADVNAKNTGGYTALHYASANNPSPAVLEVLLKAGADPRAVDNEGKTPHAAAKPENRDILWKAMMDKPLK
jgi:ankyrin repeat protein